MSWTSTPDENTPAKPPPGDPWTDNPNLVRKQGYGQWLARLEKVGAHSGVGTLSAVVKPIVRATAGFQGSGLWTPSFSQIVSKALPLGGNGEISGLTPYSIKDIGTVDFTSEGRLDALSNDGLSGVVQIGYPFPLGGEGSLDYDTAGGHKLTDGLSADLWPLLRQGGGGVGSLAGAIMAKHFRTSADTGSGALSATVDGISYPTFSVVSAAFTGSSTGAAYGLSGTINSSGTDRLGIVFCQMLSNGTGLLVGAACTWGGVAMTEEGARGLNNSLAQRLMMWTLVNPPTGSQTVAITGLDESGATQMAAVAAAMVYTNVGAFNGWSGQSGTGTTRNESGGSGNCTVAQCFGHKSTTLATGYNGTTRRTATVNLQSQPGAITIGDKSGSGAQAFSATGPSVAWASDYVEMVAP